MALVPPSPGANTQAALQSERALVWSRHVNPTWIPQPVNMTNSVSSLFDAVTGTYVSVPVAQNPFSSGQGHLPDGSVIVVGGEQLSATYPEAGRGTGRGPAR
jgi:hypothetical protein